MSTRVLAGMVATLTAVAAVNAQSNAGTPAPAIPSYSQRLADELEPRRSGECPQGIRRRFSMACRQAARSSNPGTETVLQRMSADNMRIRDEHLFSTILRELGEHDRVLVVYGNSHWTTLARTLQDGLGKPVMLTEFAPSR